MVVLLGFVFLALSMFFGWRTNSLLDDEVLGRLVGRRRVTDQELSQLEMGLRTARWTLCFIGLSSAVLVGICWALIAKNEHFVLVSLVPVTLVAGFAVAYRVFAGRVTDLINQARRRQLYNL